jgi:transposase
MIWFYKGEKRSHREIATIIGRHHSTIDYYVHQHPIQYKASDETAPVSRLDLLEAQRNPLKCALKEHVFVETLQNRFMSCRSMSKSINAKYGLNCCKSKIAEIRRQYGLKYLWATKVPKLDDRHIASRYQWAKRIQEDPCFNLPWIISDESAIVLNPQPRKLYRFPGENTDIVFQQFTKYPVKCMIWGAIGPNYKSPLIWFRGTIDSNSYIRALHENRIFDDLDQRFPNGYIFQQDGASPHTSNYSMEYLRNRVRLLPQECKWPASSPDISPIEEVWGYIKNNLDTSNIKDAETLFREVEKVWNNISLDMINHLMNSLHPRIWALEDLEGHSLNGHHNMIRCYEKSGLNGRKDSLHIKNSHQVDNALVKEFCNCVDKMLTDIMSTTIWTDQIALLERFDRSVKDLHKCLLPWVNGIVSANK